MTLPIHPKCAVCSRGLTVKETTTYRGSLKIKRLKVKGGVLVMTNRSVGIPLCSEHWEKVRDFLLKPHHYLPIQRDSIGRFSKKEE